MGGPNSATSTKNRSRHRLIIARLSRRNTSNDSRVGESAGTAEGLVEARSAGPLISVFMKIFSSHLSEFYAWINQRIEEIREKVAQNHTESEQDSRCLDH